VLVWGVGLGCWFRVVVWVVGVVVLGGFGVVLGLVWGGFGGGDERCGVG